MSNYHYFLLLKFNKFTVKIPIIKKSLEINVVFQKL